MRRRLNGGRDKRGSIYSSFEIATQTDVRHAWEVRLACDSTRLAHAFLRVRGAFERPRGLELGLSRSPPYNQMRRSQKRFQVFLVAAHMEHKRTDVENGRAHSRTWGTESHEIANLR